MSDIAPWSVDAMAAAMGAERAGPLPDAVTGLSIDTRTIARGEAFFAIQGDARDGHDFVPAALKAGAGLAVVAHDRRAALPGDAPLLVVRDVLEALRDLARAARARSQAKIVAVTGSVGKTGTKDALRLALGTSGPTHASAASYNNHWGVPLSLARLPESARYAVFEIGMNHAGEITPLTRLVRPHVAIVTNVEPVHLEFFGSVEAIADAKAEIFLGLEPGGAAVINRDGPHYLRLAQAAKAAGAARVISFGEDEKAEARLLNVCAAGGFLDRPGAHPGSRGDLQARRAGAPCGRQLARRAGGSRACRGRSCARGAGACRARAADRARPAHRAGAARRGAARS